MVNHGYQPKSDPKPPPPQGGTGSIPRVSDTLLHRVEDAFRYHTQGVLSIPENDLRGLIRMLVHLVADGLPKERQGTIAGRVMDAIAERDADIRPFCDITIKVQDGKPVLVEVTQKFKPTGTGSGTVVSYGCKIRLNSPKPPKPSISIGSETVYRP